jgi:hypothetical protein
MAFSSSLKSRSMMGNLVVEIWAWSAASVTTGTISTGIKNIMHKSSNNDVTEDTGLWVNTDQLVTVTGVTSNDTGTLMVIGNG